MQLLQHILNINIIWKLWFIWNLQPCIMSPNCIKYHIYLSLHFSSGNNQCSANHGGCGSSALCLATPAGRICACADGQHLEKDNVTCSCKLLLVVYNHYSGIIRYISNNLHNMSDRNITGHWKLVASCVARADVIDCYSGIYKWYVVEQNMQILYWHPQASQ